MESGLLTIVVMAALAVFAVALLFVAGRLARAQGELSGRLSQMAETQTAAQGQLAERLQAQERALSRHLEERLADFARRVGETLEKSAVQASSSMNDLTARLAVIDAAQKNITDLSTRVVSLQDILANKQARGEFGEIQLANLVRDALPPSAYEFQATLSNGTRADCLIKLPKPPGAIVIDSKFPLEGYRALRQARDEAARKQAVRSFATDIMNHVRAIAEKYIIPGETADSALMFLPSEAVYAELHENFRDVLEKAHRARVYTVSPNTLSALLHTVCAVLRDVRMREQAHVIQREVAVMLEDVKRLDERVGNLQKHFEMALRDIGDIRTSADKVARRGEKIREVEIGPEPDTRAVTAPDAPRRPAGPAQEPPGQSAPAPIE